MKRISAVDSARSTHDQTDTALGRLDDLRSEFLLDLSHQLRTPVTAMKLALDGLFSHIQDALTPSQRKLVGISRRNLERVVAVVENQLDLLQMMAGDGLVCRRLTDLDRLVRGLGRRTLAGDAEGDGDRPVVERAAELGAAGPLYAFTDPDQLAAVLDCIVGVGTPNTTRRILVSYDESEFVYQLDILIDLLGQDSPDEISQAPQTTPRMDFESRACRALIERLGGDAVGDKDESRRWARIRLPRYPEYDGEKDFLGPARRVRSAAEQGSAMDGEVHFIRCEVGETAGTDFLAGGNSAICEFIDRVQSLMSEGDAVIRGRRHGSIYVALANLRQRDLARAVKRLRDDDHASPHVCHPRTIRADELEAERLVIELDLM